jgi:hypothetical protein
VSEAYTTGFKYAMLSCALLAAIAAATGLLLPMRSASGAISSTS